MATSATTNKKKLKKNILYKNKTSHNNNLN